MTMNMHVRAQALTPEAMKAAFGHIDTWVFDLDNTLYPHEARIWPQVDERITIFLAELFGLDGLSSRALQKYFYQKYGTTLNGLMREYDVHPDDFLDFVHHIDVSMLAPDPALGEAIAALPGRKLIYTNGTVKHAQNVAGKLGILDRFDGLFGITEGGFTPKPDREAFERFYQAFGVAPARSAMFEDMEKNLAVPHADGMRTVLIIPRTPDPFRDAWETATMQSGHVDHVTEDLSGFLKGLL
jgi:putative hydrolase of the HAD superfamily